jgi:hypothetical protein
MTPPAVSDADALDDSSWFDSHPHRRFRARRADGGWWLIRKRGAVLLRTFSPKGGHLSDSDRALAPLWFAAVYPELFAKSARKGRQAMAGRR